MTGFGSSIAFLSYGLLSGSLPVIVTELLLIPLNGWPLRQHLRDRAPADNPADLRRDLARRDPQAARDPIAAARRRLEAQPPLQYRATAPRLATE